MLKRMLGAVLLTGGFAAAGIGRSRELRQRNAFLAALQERLERLRTEVCCRMTPLPELLPLLCGRALSREELSEQPFETVWAREIGRMCPCREEEELLLELGTALRRGDEPERAFAAAEERLRALQRLARQEVESKCRLYSAGGLCAGLLLTIVLI